MSGHHHHHSWVHRLTSAVEHRGRLCVGIDPHPGLLEAWGLPVSAEGLETFAEICVEAFVGEVAVVKPQVAFFEAYGSAGYAVLERTISVLREAGTLVVADAKRGDIGSTMAAYAQSWLGAESALSSDAVTVSPYLGFGALDPALSLAAEQGRGLFVLARTSNPEGGDLQAAQTAGECPWPSPWWTRRSGTTTRNPVWWVWWWARHADTAWICRIFPDRFSRPVSAPRGRLPVISPTSFPILENCCYRTALVVFSVPDRR